MSHVMNVIVMKMLSAPLQHGQVLTPTPWEWDSPPHQFPPKAVALLSTWSLLVLLFPAPSHAPKLHLKRIGKSEAELCWEPLPVEMQNGFITSYTIFWANSIPHVASESCLQHH